MTKAEIIRLGFEAGRGLFANEQLLRPCRLMAVRAEACDSCRLRAKGFEEAGVADPGRYDANQCPRFSVSAWPSEIHRWGSPFGLQPGLRPRLP